MEHNFEVDCRRTVNAVGNYSIVSYRATAPDGVDVSPYKERYIGVVKVSPADADASEAIERDIRAQRDAARVAERETIAISVSS